MITQFIGQATVKCLTVVVNANMEMNSGSIAIMSWHLHKNIVMQAANLYNEFAWAQENFDAGG